MHNNASEIIIDSTVYTKVKTPYIKVIYPKFYVNLLLQFINASPHKSILPVQGFIFAKHQ